MGMTVCMEHPQHGVHVAYSIVEVERLKASGWVERKKKRETLRLPKKREKK